MTRLWVVRHGETEWSSNGRQTSTTDIPLTPAGRESAKLLAKRLDQVSFGRAWTSPRQRARVTAELTGYPDAVVDDRLVEWDYGEYEGLTRVQVREQDPTWTVWTGRNPGGETAEQVTARLDSFIADVRASGVDDAIAFGHGHSLRALAARWCGLEVAIGQYLDLDTATISVLGQDRETPVIMRWNDIRD